MVVMIAREIGQRIYCIRKELKLTQKEFAEKISLSQAHISELEKGRNLITIELVLKLYDSYGIDPGYLLLGEQKKILDSDTKYFIEWYLNLKDDKIKKCVISFCDILMSFSKTK